MNEKCARKKECYRHEAEPSEYQAYADFNEKDCKDFWRINERDNKLNK